MFNNPLGRLLQSVVSHLPYASQPFGYRPLINNSSQIASLHTRLCFKICNSFEYHESYFQSVSEDVGNSGKVPTIFS